MPFRNQLLKDFDAPYDVYILINHMTGDEYYVSMKDLERKFGKDVSKVLNGGTDHWTVVRKNGLQENVFTLY